MIVHHERRWVYLGLPRTGSTALHAFLEGLGGRTVGEEQHDVAVPAACRGYLVFATVREPYHRAASLWRMFQGDVRKGAAWTRGQPPETATDFGCFVAQVLHGRELFSPTYQWTLCEWLRHVPEGVAVRTIQLERLGEGLLALGIVSRPTQVPVRNRSRQRDWRALYEDADAAEGVRRWAREDFARFDYSEKVPA